MMLLILNYPTAKDSVFLNSTLKLNLFLTLSQITKKFNFAVRVILTPLMYLAIPLSVWFTILTLIKTNAKDFNSRLTAGGIQSTWIKWSNSSRNLS